MPIIERDDWQQQADDYGFLFHTMYGEKYWDESCYYQFSLSEIEDSIEAPTEDIHQMCLHAVDCVLKDEQWLRHFGIPEKHWDFVRTSWMNREPSLYSRLDFCYAGHGPAKLLENNADTPTSLYETGFWQWLWLEQQVNCGRLHRLCDQFNSLQEKLVNRFADLQYLTPGRHLHFSCSKDTDEDRGTVQYLQDCAKAAGIDSTFVYIDDIGHGEGDVYTDLDDQIITWMFKLYPWEFMLQEPFADILPAARVRWLEPPWKAIVSNKAMMPMLWKLFPDHPNLLPSYFESEFNGQFVNDSWIKKPIFSREGANISLLQQGRETALSDGPYGEEGFIYQQYNPLPKFGDNYTLIGSWLIDDEAAGISVREDKNVITQDLSRYVPHVIFD